MPRGDHPDTGPNPAEAGLPAVCIETRHTKAFLKAQVNKTDRNDARGMMRVNLFRPVHVKTLTSQKRRALLTARKLLQEKAIAIENDVRGLLRNFGLKVGIIGTVGFEARIRELIDGTPDLGEIVSPLLAAREQLRAEFAKLHVEVVDLVRDDDTCRQDPNLHAETHDVGACETFQFRVGEAARIHPHASLGAAKRQVHQCTLQGHQECKRLHFIGGRM